MFTVVPFVKMNGERRKVVFLANAANIHTERWAKHLSKKFSITILSFEKNSIDGIEIINLNSPFGGLFRYLYVLPTVKSIIAKVKPDLLHVHYAGGYGLLGVLSESHPCIVSVWGSDIYQAPVNSLIHRNILKFILAKADFLCSTSIAMAKEAQKYTSKVFTITPFGIDIDTYFPAHQADSSGEYIIGTVKKLDNAYGVDRLIHAFALLHIWMPQAKLRLLIVGDGGSRDALLRLADSLGITSMVNFFGQASQEDVPILLNQMTVYVALSRSESFGVAILEASACGLPVVVSDAGGLPEVVVNGETGYIIQNGNPKLAARAIKSLIDDRDLRIHMGEAGRTFVKNRYQWDKTAKVLDDLYDSVI